MHHHNDLAMDQISPYETLVLPLTSKNWGSRILCNHSLTHKQLEMKLMMHLYGCTLSYFGTSLGWMDINIRLALKSHGYVRRSSIYFCYFLPMLSFYASFVYLLCLFFPCALSHFMHTSSVYFGYFFSVCPLILCIVYLLLLFFVPVFLHLVLVWTASGWILGDN